MMTDLDQGLRRGHRNPGRERSRQSSVVTEVAFTYSLKRLGNAALGTSDPKPTIHYYFSPFTTGRARGYGICPPSLFKKGRPCEARGEPSIGRLDCGRQG